MNGCFGATSHVQGVSGSFFTFCNEPWQKVKKDPDTPERTVAPIAASKQDVFVVMSRGAAVMNGLPAGSDPFSCLTAATDHPIVALEPPV